jgi:hypothetical protein
MYEYDSLALASDTYFFSVNIYASTLDDQKKKKIGAYKESLLSSS